MSVGFEGTALDADLGALLAAGIGGVILFGRNVVEREQVRRLTESIKRAAPGPVVISVDQEGGAVQRLREGFSRLPALRDVGEHDDVALSETLGRLTGRELRAVGVDLDFAPVLDVDTNPSNPVIGRRSFSADPQTVARHGVAFGRGLEAAGVAACGKHFPGHGDTELDSHLALPRLSHGRARLDAVELVPFRAWSQAGLASMMTAHVVFDAIEPGVPATLSRRALVGLLREELGFAGLLVSDDLNMQAISERWGIGAAAVEAVRAGVDHLLVCRDASRAWAALEALERALSEGRIEAAVARAALSRGAAFRSRWSGPSRGRLDDTVLAQHRQLLAPVRTRPAPTTLDPTEQVHRPVPARSPGDLTPGASVPEPPRQEPPNPKGGER